MLDLSKLWLRIQPEILTVPFMFMLLSLSLSLLILLYISIPSIGALAALTLIPAAAWYAITGIILVATTLYSIFPSIQKTILKKKITRGQQEIEGYNQHIEENEQWIKRSEKKIEGNDQHIEENEQEIENYRQHIGDCEQEIKNYRQLIENYRQHIGDCEQHTTNCKQNITNCRQLIKNCEQKLKLLQQKKKTPIPIYAAIILSLLAIALYTFVVFPITLPVAMVACAVIQIIGLGRLTFKSHDGSKTTAQKWYDRLLLILPFAVCSIATMIIILISPTWTQILVQLSITQAFPPLTIALLVLSSVILVLCLLKAVDAKGIYDARYSTKKFPETISDSELFNPPPLMNMEDIKRNQQRLEDLTIGNSTSDTNPDSTDTIPKNH